VSTDYFLGARRWARCRWPRRQDRGGHLTGEFTPEKKELCAVARFPDGPPRSRGSLWRMRIRRNRGGRDKGISSGCARGVEVVCSSQRASPVGKAVDGEKGDLAPRRELISPGIPWGLLSPRVIVRGRLVFTTTLDYADSTLQNSATDQRADALTKARVLVAFLQSSIGCWVA